MVRVPGHLSGPFDELIVYQSWCGYRVSAKDLLQGKEAVRLYFPCRLGGVPSVCAGWVNVTKGSGLDPERAP